MEPLNLKKLPPFNIRILDSDEYIKRKGCLPVTNLSIFESSSTRFHPDGLYSEAIFGQIGSKDRLVKRGYIDLRTKIITPHLFKQVMMLKTFYKDVLAGKAYAKIAPNGDLTLTTPDDPEGHSGFQWFVDVLPTLKFPQTDSVQRQDRIALIEKFKDLLLIDKFIVLPAGVRDIRLVPGRRVSPEEINKFYTSLISLTQALPATPTSNPVFDSIKYQIQMKVMEVYNYIANLVEGKGGFAQRKFAARSVVYGSRNVITAAPLTRITSTKDDPHIFDVNEAFVPLFQAIKSSMPLMVHELKTTFFDQIFLNQSDNVPLIDPERGYALLYANVSYNETTRFTTSDGINDLMSNFRNEEIHFDPVTCKGKLPDEDTPRDFYLYMCYDNDDEIYFFRDVTVFTDYWHSHNRFSTRGIEDLLKPLEPFKDEIIIVGDAARETYLDGNEADSVDVIPKSDTIADKILALNSDKINVYKSDAYKEYLSSVFTVDDFTFISPERLYQELKQSTRASDKLAFNKLKRVVYDQGRLRPLTWVELFYIAAFSALHNKHGVLTRHPVLNLENIVPDRLHITSTAVSRKVRLRSLQSDASIDPICPEYPVMNSHVKESLSVHSAHLERYGGDHKKLWHSKVTYCEKPA